MVDVNLLPGDDDPFAPIELIFYAFRAFTAKPDAILAERGLARLHHRILYFVARHPGRRVSDLLAILGVSKQALHGPLKQLVAMGLVEVSPDPGDGRARCLSLSSEGAELEARLSQTQRELLERVFAEQGEAAELAWRKVMRGLAGSAP
ncbi:MAG: MarR family transcriptional regulator [Candidatus Dactylopiibacterium carminicum]|uniref:MarR family transcriptional regulator n=1 Tax=Candidatus Dactylopiibacterium carminicum TaxID=857335 RepID=A0A272ETE2_9RHOO|nr:MarR family transcriptional regulator [Candidatus Dactylopiibacterium carminicum]KAF7599364.1 MarR family transcriptional regulator [Candidatus Dactylopiibacterium carminicum]PAS93374.1 MAG: MarR family transcriptional regulator [Candidatus Dactylopiibacterium carminicum]PAS98327.1 MAG: MarR family transcriptional regulator [Candidatus Dactylopiibacterium carminicum]PAS99374.1 MAG: MarR family transcriptional regulator [Candidatus Dactylopiibacterium carminicum]